MIATEIDNEAFIVRLTRPEIRNPLSIAVLESLLEIVGRVGNDRSITKFVITGTDDSFASGADLREIAKVTAEEARSFAERGQMLMSRINNMSVMTVAAVNGFCFGGGLDLALACDHRLASPNAKFAHPGAGLGIITGWGGTQRLPRLVGTASANEIFFTASPIDAHTAARIGLVDEVVDDVLSRALELTADSAI